MLKWIKIVVLIFTVSNTVKAQDMHFTQYYASRLYLNPAFTGAGTCSKFSMTYRNQWPGAKKGYTSSIVSFDHYLHKEKFGLGLLLSNDVAGSGGLKRTTINPLLAYEARLSRGVVLRFGAAPSIGFVSVDYNKLIFGDQIVRSGGLPTVSTIETPYQNLTYFDFSAGTLVYGEDFWAGITLMHLFKPVEGLIAPNTYDYLPKKISFHGGYRFTIEEDAKNPNNSKYFSPSFNYRGQKDFDQFDLGFYYSFGMINVGFWYRGIPGFKAYAAGYGNNDAVAFILGVQDDRFSFGYSYDVTVSKLTIASLGAHEISMAYNFCDPNKKRKRTFPVHCPKF